MLSTPNEAARVNTPASGRLHKTNSTRAKSPAAKYRMMFSAFVPDPEAKIANFFII